MSDKKVLIITYYWPPSGGSGVQRWLKFAKYLPQFDWKPIIYTPENPSFAIRDESLLTEVPAVAEIIKLPIWEPYDWFFRFSRFFGARRGTQSDVPSTGGQSFFQKISTWIRGKDLAVARRVLAAIVELIKVRRFMAQILLRCGGAVEEQRRSAGPNREEMGDEGTPTPGCF